MLVNILLQIVNWVISLSISFIYLLFNQIFFLEKNQERIGAKTLSIIRFQPVIPALFLLNHH